MLESLRNGLQGAIKKLLGSSVVDEAAIKEFVRDLQRTLIQADVNVKLVLSVTENVQRRALEEKPIGGMTRKDQIVKILYEELDRMLGGEQPLKLDRGKTNVIVMLGADPWPRDSLSYRQELPDGHFVPGLSGSLNIRGHASPP